MKTARAALPITGKQPSVCLPGEIYKNRLVMYGGKDLFKEVSRTETETAGVEAGMTAEMFFPQKVTVHEQLYSVFFIV